MSENLLVYFSSHLKNIFAIICKVEVGNTLHNPVYNAAATLAPSISKGPVKQGKHEDCLQDKSNEIFSKDSVQHRAEKKSCWFSVGRDGLLAKHPPKGGEM